MKMHNNIVSTAAGNVWRVFLARDGEKYTLITYTIVSDDPIIVAAHSDGNESAPYISINSMNAAFDALPENGRVIRSGKISAGTPSFPKTGDSAAVITSNAPDADSIDSATMSATIAGSRLKHVIAPSFAPVKNAAK